MGYANSHGEYDKIIGDMLIKMQEKRKVNKKIKKNGEEACQLSLYLNDSLSKGIDSICIFTHDSPDPDALASALAMKAIAESHNMKANILYAGDIKHSQNRAIVNILVENNMGRVDDLVNGELEELKSKVKDSLIAIIDTQHFRGGNCNSPSFLFGEERIPNIIIDHHEKKDIEGEFVLVDMVGACSTLMFELCNATKTKIDKQSKLATALYIGIEKDTDDFKRESVCDRDKEAHEALRNILNFDLYFDIIKCPQPLALIGLKSLAYSKFFHKDHNSIFSGVGFIEARNESFIAEIADEMMRYNGIDNVMVIGIVDEGFGKNKYLKASFRHTGVVVNANDFVQKIFGKSSGGGRPGAAAATVELDCILANTIDHAEKEELIDLFKKIFDAYSSKMMMEIKN